MTQKNSRNLVLLLALAVSASNSILPLEAKGSRRSADESACRACVVKAASYFASNKLGQASNLLGEYAGKCPNNAQLHLLYSTILIRLGNHSAEAEQEAALACAAQKDLQAAHLQYALTLLANNKFTQATREFEAVTNLNPGSYEAWSGLADLYKRQRRDAEAEQSAQKAAFLEPATQTIKLSVLQNLKKAGRLAQARRELETLLGEARSAPEFEQLLANEALQIGAYDQAIEACKDVIKAYPGSAGPRRCLALAQFLERQYAQAETSADKILADMKGSAEIFALRALCRLQQGKTEGAQSDLKSAREIDASASFVMLAEGLLMLSRGDFENAADSLKFASEAYTKGSQADGVPQSLAHLSLSRLNRKQGLLSEATQEARAAAGDKRFLTQSWALEARSLLADGRGADTLSRAKKLVEQARLADAEEPEALLAEAFCQIRAGQFAEARKLAEKVTELSPYESDSRLALAQIAQHEGNSGSEAQELERGLQLSAGDPELLYELGLLYLKENQAAKAAPLLKQANEHRVRGPEICFALAEACEKNGETGESLKYYKKSISQGLSGDSSEQAKAAISRLESNK
jgi:cellulose synthase operon protein C